MISDSPRNGVLEVLPSLSSSTQRYTICDQLSIQLVNAIVSEGKIEYQFYSRPSEYNTFTAFQQSYSLSPSLNVSIPIYSFLQNEVSYLIQCQARNTITKDVAIYEKEIVVLQECTSTFEPNLNMDTNITEYVYNVYLFISTPDHDNHPNLTNIISTAFSEPTEDCNVHLLRFDIVGKLLLKKTSLENVGFYFDYIQKISPLFMKENRSKYTLCFSQSPTLVKKFFYVIGSLYELYQNSYTHMTQITFDSLVYMLAFNASQFNMNGFLPQDEGIQPFSFPGYSSHFMKLFDDDEYFSLSFNDPLSPIVKRSSSLQLISSTILIPLYHHPQNVSVPFSGSFSGSYECHTFKNSLKVNTECKITLQNTSMILCTCTTPPLFMNQFRNDFYYVFTLSQLSDPPPNNTPDYLLWIILGSCLSACCLCIPILFLLIFIIFSRFMYEKYRDAKKSRMTVLDESSIESFDSCLSDLKNEYPTPDPIRLKEFPRKYFIEENSYY